MKIATAQGRSSRNWSNQEMSWEGFCSRCAQTVYTRETLKEFLGMKGNQADDIKDVGCFVLGELKGKTRSKQSILSRSAITLDMDKGVPDVWDKVICHLPWRLCVYSTHKHSPVVPRLRICIPLSRNVSPEEYEPLARLAANRMDLSMFDPTGFQASRCFFWPSTPKDGDFFFRQQDGLLLDPDVLLAEYRDWQDTSSWPLCPGESRKTAAVDKAEDPCSKQNLVGTFCRTYSAQEALEKFLPDIYSATDDPNRYHYAPSHSSAGVLIFDDKFIYSCHAKDPCANRLCNAFDCVRIHKFGELDAEAAEHTPASKLPSFQAMQEFVLSDEKVKKQLLSEKTAQAQMDFEVTDWMTDLELDKSGKIKPSVQNIQLILLNDENLQSIVYNEFTGFFDVIGELPWDQVKPGWSDSDMENLKIYFETVYGLWVPGKLKTVFTGTITGQRKYHPVKNYLDSLTWDGRERLDTLLIDYLGAEDSEYVRAVTRMTLTAAIARIYKPGIKYDSILTLIGPQGIGKSTLISILGKEWYSDSLTIADMRDKTAAEKLSGNWILEIGELAGMRRVDVETIKGFITRTDDKFRAAYGVSVESHPRSCILIASTNAALLRDTTGNRRFLPVEVSGEGKYKAWDLTSPDQIWAEAKARYEAGTDLFLPASLLSQAETHQRMALETDDREGMVQEYLNRLLPSSWESMDLTERRSFLDGNEFGKREDGIYLRQYVTPIEIWCECFRKDRADLNKGASVEIRMILNRLGWITAKNSSGQEAKKRFMLYGPQRYYTRPEANPDQKEDEISIKKLLN